MTTVFAWVLLFFVAGLGEESHVSSELITAGSVGSVAGTSTTAERIDGIIFLGDILLARDVEARQRRYGLHHPFSRMSFPPHYAVIGNFESTIPQVHRMTPALQMRFSSPTSSVAVLRAAGVTHVSLANNHAFDFGVDSFLHTRKQLSAGGLTPFGSPGEVSTSSVTFVTVGDTRVAVVGLNFVSHLPDRSEVTDILAQASEHSDVQVVYVHWGPEYQLVKHVSQQTQAQLLVLAGADLIIGHHPHVVQNIDYVDGVLVIYSLGNFVFDQYFSRDVQEGLVAVYAPRSETVQLLPVTSLDGRTQPRFMTESERLVFLGSLAERSVTIPQSQIIEGMVPLRSSVASSTKTAMISQ